MLTIDLLRSMIHNLVMGQWGTCSHSVGTVALAHRANITAEVREVPGGFCQCPFVVASKQHKSFPNVLPLSLFHFSLTLCVYLRVFQNLPILLIKKKIFLVMFSVKICVKNMTNQKKKGFNPNIFSAKKETI